MKPGRLLLVALFAEGCAGSDPSGAAPWCRTEEPALDPSFRAVEPARAQVALGQEVGCAILDATGARCFRWGSRGQASVFVPGQFAQVVASGPELLLVRADGEVIHMMAIDDPPKAVGNGVSHADLLRPGNAVGVSFRGRVVPMVAAVASEVRRNDETEWKDVATTGLTTCGLRASDGGVECWGRDACMQATPSGRFVDVDVGAGFACGLREDGRVLCWGERTPPVPDEPVARFELEGDRIHTSEAATRQVDRAHDGIECSLEANGSLTCDPVIDPFAPAPSDNALIEPTRRGVGDRTACQRAQACACAIDDPVACAEGTQLVNVAPDACGRWLDGFVGRLAAGGTLPLACL